MKRLVCFVCITLLLLPMCACKKKQAPAQQNATSAAASQTDPTGTQKSDPTKAAVPTATTAPTVTPAPTATSAPTATPSPKPVAITNDLLVKNMMAVDSYYRKIFTSATEDGQKWEEYNELAYAKNPFTEYILLDFPTVSTTNETLIIGDIYWSRMNDEKWTKSLPGNWFTERPPEFRYEISTQHFPIDYGKLTLKPVGTEKVNGLDCVKYDVSGTYDDEYTDMDIKFHITLSGSGNVWISADPGIREVIISQRVKLNADIKTVEYTDPDGNLLHTVQELEIKDDVTGINSTVIQPPPESETITLENAPDEDEEIADNLSVAEALAAGNVTQAQADSWVGKGWETDYGRIIFELVNGHLLGSWVWDDNTKIGSSLSDYLVGTFDGNVLKGKLMYLSESGEFELTMDASGQSFSGKAKLDGSNDWFNWNGQVSN